MALQVGGSREHFALPVSYPSTTLRVVPLPIAFGDGEDERAQASRPTIGMGWLRLK